MGQDEKDLYPSPSLEPASENGSQHADYHAVDVFGPEEDHQIQYKTLSWPLVAVLMIAEIVSNGSRCLPNGPISRWKGVSHLKARRYVLPLAPSARFHVSYREK